MQRLLEVLDRVVTWLVMVAMALMVAVVSAQVVLRYAFNSSLDWADDIGRLLFVASVFLAVPLAVREGSHIAIGLLTERLSARLRDLCARVMALLSAGMMLIITWHAVNVSVEQWSELMPTVNLTVASFMLPVIVGAGLSALHLIRIVAVGPPRASALAAE
ncbi:MAG: TRAP transporter small permease [Burkholderiales bacterium]